MLYVCIYVAPWSCEARHFVPLYVPTCSGMTIKLNLNLTWLDGASVEGAHDGGRGSGSSEFAEEVETLLCFLGQCCSVVGPGEVLCDVYTQELGAAHSLHSRTIDGQRSMLSVHSPEVNNNLLRLLHIQREIVVNFHKSRLASRFGERKCCHNNKPVCETLGCILKILWSEL